VRIVDPNRHFVSAELSQLWLPLNVAGLGIDRQARWSSHNRVGEDIPFFIHRLRWIEIVGQQAAPISVIVQRSSHLR
jgi:hypothetical protein